MKTTMRKQLIYLLQRGINILVWFQAKLDPSILQPVEEAPAVEVPLLDEGPEWETPTHEELSLSSQEVFDARVRAALAIRDSHILMEREAEQRQQASIKQTLAAGTRAAELRALKDQARAALDKVKYVPGKRQRRMVTLGPRSLDKPKDNLDNL